METLNKQTTLEICFKVIENGICGGVAHESGRHIINNFDGDTTDLFYYILEEVLDIVDCNEYTDTTEFKVELLFTEEMEDGSKDFNSSYFECYVDNGEVYTFDTSYISDTNKREKEMLEEFESALADHYY